ncbi:endonuclease exonuclease phosphatase family protein [Colletotrichum musicola]|uniref:Endonuclease exonuclease phosphatase family protein n=1 Tax=Colletotrichum musicola TaxID=2175873 RepID=A0A8H6J6E8_9PEZI|nr:endonuclease exonuclease phosphatase family protein [Colletotrichum musicola]
MGQPNSEETLPLRLITLNVRYAIKKTLLPNEHPWAVRCPRLAAQLRVATAGQQNTFICIQEAQHQQLLDLQTELGPQWAHIGRGRADGELDGEFSPVFYRGDHWDLQRTQTYWLSPTPNTPSSAHKTSGERVVVMSTHLDHRSSEARAESAKLLLRLARQWQEEASAEHGYVPVFLGGDFNSGPEDEPHRILTTGSDAMADIKDLVPESRRYGNDITYTTFGEAEPTIIDYLFVLDPRGISFLNFAVLCNRFDDAIYYSDHRTVLADMEIPANKT